MNRNSGTEENVWILNPCLDVFFVCGGLLWLFVAMTAAATAFSGAQSAGLATVVIFVGGIMFADAHNAATILRLIEEPGLAARHVFVARVLPFLLLLFIPLALSSGLVLSCAVKLYLILIAQHVTAQAYGITMIYLRKTSLPVTAQDQKSLKFAFEAMMMVGIFRQLSSYSPSAALGIDVPQTVLLPNWTYTVMSLTASLATLYAFAKLFQAAKQSKARVHPGALMVATSTLLVFIAGNNLGAASLYSAALFHATQYLAVTTAFTFATRQTTGASHLVLKVFDEEKIFYWLRCLAVGIMLYIIVPMGISKLGYSPIAAVAAVFCAVNFHHFAADGVIWRSRKVARMGA